MDREDLDRVSMLLPPPAAGRGSATAVGAGVLLVTPLVTLSPNLAAASSRSDARTKSEASAAALALRRSDPSVGGRWTPHLAEPATATSTTPPLSAPLVDASNVRLAPHPR